MSRWLLDVFRELDRRIEERWTAGNLSHGFWRSGAIPRLTPVDTMREYGFWQGRADLGHGLCGQVSVSLIGGHTRIGLFLPNKLLEGMTTLGEPVSSAVASAHDGRPAAIIRQMGADTLFDRIFTEAPFSAAWLRDCIGEGSVFADNDFADRSLEILKMHLSWRVIDLWESALRTVLNRQSHEHAGGGQEIAVYSSKPIPATVTEALPITLRESWEMGEDSWLSILSSDSLSTDDMEKALKQVLPHHDVRKGRGGVD